MEQSKGKPTGRTGPPPDTTMLSKMSASIIQLTLLANFVGVCIYAFFSTGDEVLCGSGITEKACYLPGVDWTGYVLLSCLILTLISLMLMSKPKATK